MPQSSFWSRACVGGAMPDDGASVVARSDSRGHAIAEITARNLSDAGVIHVDVARLPDEWGDTDTCLLGVHLDSGESFTLTLQVDHNLGSLVTEAYATRRPLDELLARMTPLGGRGLPEGVEIWDPAVARASLAAAIERGRKAPDWLAGEGWLALCPAVEWVLAHLPEGGQPERERVWPALVIEDLRREFLASPEGAVVDDADDDYALDLIVFFGNRDNRGGPLRWSPAVVERFLLEWIPTTPAAPYAEVAAVPEVLACWVHFAHRREGVDDELTGEVLATIREAAEPYGLTMISIDPYGDLED